MAEATAEIDEQADGGQKPKFDPNKPYQPVKSEKPAFDPDKPYEPVDEKKNGVSSKTLAASPSASSNAPTQTVTPDTPSASSIPSLHENIFGVDAPKKTTKQTVYHGGIPLAEFDKQQKAKIEKEKEENIGKLKDLMNKPNANLVADDKGSLVDIAEKKYLQSYKTDEQKQKIHQQKTQFTQHYLDGKLDGEDVSFIKGAINWGGTATNDQIATAINNKTEFLRKAGDAAVEKGVHNYLSEIKKIDDKIAAIKQQNVGMADLEGLENQKAFMQRSLTRSYDAELNKLVPNAIGDLKTTNYGNKSWDEVLQGATVEKGKKPETGKPLFDESALLQTNPDNTFSAGIIKYNKDTHTLTPESTAAVLKWADNWLDKKNNGIVNAQVTGDDEAKKRNYQEFGKSVVDYLNHNVIVEHNQKKFLNDVAKESPAAKAYVNHIEELKNGLAGEDYKAADSLAKVEEDKSIIQLKEKYWGSSGIIMTHPEFEKIQHKYADAVGNKTMTEDVAKKNMDAEIHNDPALKNIFKQQEKDIDNLRNSSMKLRRDYLTKVISKVDPNLVVYDSGNWGFKGMSETQSRMLIRKINNGLAETAGKTLHDQSKALGEKAEDRAKALGAFESSLRESASAMASSVYKSLFDKTGYGGDDLRMYQGERLANAPLSETDEAKKWEWKGLTSLLDYKFYLANIGKQVPIFAGAAVTGAITEGAGLPEYASILASAGLFTAQDGLSTYETLTNSTDKFGNRLTQTDAANGAARAASDEFMPNLAMMYLNLGTLSRAKYISKPSLLKEIAKVPVNAALGAIPMAATSYLGYANQMEAEGKNPDFWDYAQDGAFTKSLIDGVIGGGLIGLAHVPGQHVKMIENWKNILNTSTGEFHDNSLYNIAMQHAVNGDQKPFRDALVIHANIEDFHGRQIEKESLMKAEKYSVELGRVFDAMKIEPRTASVDELYKAHNMALSNMNLHFAEAAGNNKALADIYSKQSKQYAELANSAFEGKAKYHYLIDRNDKPIFLSDQSFRALEQEGTLKKWMQDGTIKEAIKNDDPEFREKFKMDNLAPITKEEKKENKLLDAGKEAIKKSIEAGLIAEHLGDALIKNPEQELKFIADQARGIMRGSEGEPIKSDLPGAEKATREYYSDAVVDAALKLYPEDISSQSKKESNEKENTTIGDEAKEGERLKETEQGRDEGSAGKKDVGATDKYVSGDRFGNKPIFSDFNSTIADSEGKLLPFGEEIKQRIEHGEPITIVTRSGGEGDEANEKRMLDALGFEKKPDNLKIIQGVSPEEKAAIAAKEGGVLVDNSNSVSEAAKDKSDFVNANELNKPSNLAMGEWGDKASNVGGEVGSVGVGGDVVELSNGNKLVLNKDRSVKAGKNFAFDENSYDVQDKDGNKIGNIHISDRGDYYQISNVNLKNERTGLGTEIYETIIKQLDKPLISDKALSEKAKGLWDKLVKKGLAEKFKDTFELGNKTYTEDRYRTKAVEQSLKEQTNTPNNKTNQNEKENLRSGQDKSNADNSKAPAKESEEKISQRYKRVTDEQHLVTPYDRALKYFADGGRINPSEMERIFGGKGDKGARISLIKNDAGTVKQIAHELWESDPSGKYEDTHYIDAIESALRDFPSKAAMQKDIVERYDVDAAYEKHVAQHGEDFKNIYDNLSDDDINHILDLESQGKDSEIDDFLNNKTDNNAIPNEPAKKGTGDDKKSVPLTDEEKGSAAPPPQEPPEKIGEENTSPQKEWTAVRKQKLAEIDGVKEMFEKRGVKGWEQTYESALKNVQGMYPDKNLYDALKSRVEHFSGMLDRGELFNPTSEDNAAFNVFRNLTDAKIADIKGWDSDDEVIRAGALDEFKGYQKDLFDIARVTNPEGEAGRAFNILQSETLNTDAGLKIRRMELMDANGGNKLSDEDMKWTADQWEKEKEIIQKINDAKEKGLREAFDKQIQALTKEFNEKLKKTKGGKPTEAKEKRDNLLKQSGKEFADKIRSGKLKGTFATVPGFTQAVNVTIEAIAQIVEKGASLAQAISNYVKEQGIKDKAKFTNDFLGVLENMEKKGDYLDKIKELAKSDEVSTITKKMVAANFIRDYVNSHIGLHDAKDILDAAHEGLKEPLPDLTKEKLIEAYLKQGEFKVPTKKELESGLRQETEKFTKITKLDKDINDLTKKQNLYRLEKKQNKTPFDKDIDAKLKQRKNLLVEKGLKVSNDDKFTKASYDQRAKSHNERLDNIGKMVDDKLADKNIPDEQKKELVKLKQQLDASKIQIDENSRLSQKKVLDEGRYVLNSIKNGFKGDDGIRRELQKTLDKFDADKEETEQDIKLARTKQQYIRDIDEAQRKINAGEYEDKQPIVLKKSDAELVELEKYKRFFEQAYEKKKRDFQKQQKTTTKRLADFGRAAQVLFLIRKFSTFANVTASASLKPQLNALSKISTGRLFDALPFELTKSISERAKLGGESNSPETIKSLQQSIWRQFNEKQLGDLYDKANNAYEKSDHEYQVAKGELENIEDKNSKEYKAKSAEVEKLNNQNNKNLVAAIATARYQFIAGSSIEEAWQVLLHRTAKIDEVFGQFDKESLIKSHPDESKSEKRNAALDNITYVGNFITRSHAAMKNFSSRAEFAAGFTARLEGAVADGVDISKPEKILEIANESYLDWERGKYGESNAISDQWNEITKAVDKISPQAATLMKLDVAITRVPVNMAKEAILEYTVGSIIGSAKAWKAYNEAKGRTLNLGYTDEAGEQFKAELKNQLRQLDPKEAAIIARSFRKGGFGLGLFALAAIGGVSFGGYPHLGMTKEDKEKKAREKETHVPEIKTQEIKIGGYTLPLWVGKIIEHTPAFAPALNALNLNAVYKNSIKSGETTPIAVKNAVMSNVEHLAFSIPQIQNFAFPLAKTLVDRFSDWKWDDVDKDGNPIKRIPLEASDYLKLLPFGDKKSILSDRYYREATSVIKGYKREISQIENNASIPKSQKEEQIKKIREEEQKTIDLIYLNNKKNPQ